MVRWWLRYTWRDRLTLLSDPRGVLSAGTGTSMWAAGEILSDFLAERRELCRSARALELGAGTGVVGLTAAFFGAEVTLTDLPRQLPLLRRNVEANGLEHTEVRELDWSDEQQRTMAMGDWDLILGSDVAYDPMLFEPLVQTLRAQSTEKTTIYLALADREEEDEPKVSDFVACASGFEVEVVCEGRPEPQQSLTKVLRMPLAAKELRHG